MSERKSLGDRGEDAAAHYLESNGWTIVDRNITTSFGEIDIIVEKMVDRGRGKARLVVFVEVKTRRPRKCLRPEYNVTFAKRKKIGRLARWWMGRNGRNAIARFDVVAIEWPRGQAPAIRHYPAVFDAEGRLN